MGQHFPYCRDSLESVCLQMNPENKGTSGSGPWSATEVILGPRTLKAFSIPAGPTKQIPESTNSIELVSNESWNVGPRTRARRLLVQLPHLTVEQIEALEEDLLLQVTAQVVQRWGLNPMAPAPLCRALQGSLFASRLKALTQLLEMHNLILNSFSPLCMNLKLQFVKTHKH